MRTVPRSRHNPQFNGDTLAASLAAARHRLRATPGTRRLSPRAAPIRRMPAGATLSFRGYADYMQTPAFADNLAS